MDLLCSACLARANRFQWLAAVQNYHLFHSAKQECKSNCLWFQQSCVAERLRGCCPRVRCPCSASCSPVITVMPRRKANRNLCLMSESGDECNRRSCAGVQRSSDWSAARRETTGRSPGPGNKECVCVVCVHNRSRSRWRRTTAEGCRSGTWKWPSSSTRLQLQCDVSVLVVRPLLCLPFCWNPEKAKHRVCMPHTDFVRAQHGSVISLRIKLLRQPLCRMACLRLCAGSFLPCLDQGRVTKWPWHISV